MSTSMSFFWNLATAWCLGGRKWTFSFFVFNWETLRKMTADRCIALGGCRCCWRTWIGSEGGCSSTTCQRLLRRIQLSPIGGAGVVSFCPRENSKLCPSFSHCHVFSLMPALPLKSLCLSVQAFMVGGVTGTMWVPMGMFDRPTAPERWCSSCHSEALVWHDPQLIWIPESSKPALYSFFVFYVLFLLLWNCHWLDELYRPCLPAEEIKKTPPTCSAGCNEYSLLIYSTSRSKSCMPFSKSVPFIFFLTG